MTGRAFPQGRTPHIVGVAAAKGGIGQSTVCLDWARALGRSGRRCLVVEAAGGDLAWMGGATPSAFAEDVGAGRVSLDRAVVAVEPNVELLTTGNEWAVYGSPETAGQKTLVSALRNATWTDCVIDLGNVSPDHSNPLWQACSDIALLLTDDLACVSRSYALLRRLTRLAWDNRVVLVLNRMDNAAQATSLSKRFNQITQQFLGRTWPLIGVVPNAEEERRLKAVSAWAVATGRVTDPSANPVERIIRSAQTADNQ